MKTLQISAALIVAILSSLSSREPAVADTEFQGVVPLELVKSILGNGPYGETNIYSDRLESFPAFEVPNDFEILGSIDRGGYSQSLVLTTDLPPPQAIMEIASSLAREGYTEFDTFSMQLEETGFVSSKPSSQVESQRLCHDSQGFMSLVYMEFDTTNTVTLSANKSDPGRSCATQLTEMRLSMDRMGGMMTGVQRYVPRLEVPADSTPNRSPMLRAGSGGSANDYETDSTLQINWDIEQVYRHFKTQIENQQWQPDAENTGTASATGSWTLNPEANMNLIGILTVLKTDDSVFQLKFRVVSTGSGSNSRGFGVFRATN